MADVQQVQIVRVIDEWPDRLAPELRWRVRDLMAPNGAAVLELGHPAKMDWRRMDVLHREVAERLSALLAERRQESEPEGGSETLGFFHPGAPGGPPSEPEGGR